MLSGGKRKKLKVKKLEFLIYHKLTPHSSLLTPHSLLLTPHSSLLTPHSLPTQHSALSTQYLLSTQHSALLTIFKIMLPEQQQRILGYFIEEARDHLNTIEQGLLNLQQTLDDPEMINEVFRAAHSIKGGAAMLSLNSIQRTAHRLEDCFKVLKENPISIDQKLESLFLGVSDTLKALLEHLSGPFGLSDEQANTLMSEAEPVFAWLNEHLEFLLGQNGTAIKVSTLVEPVQYNHNNPDLQQHTSSESDWQQFQNAVMQKLRDMLQLFKQDATESSRKGLSACCQYLAIIGEDLKLTNWCHLCKGAATAVTNLDNSYLTLAKVVITEIKRAQELALAGRDNEIVISPQLEALISTPDIELLELSSDFFDADDSQDDIIRVTESTDGVEINDLNQMSNEELHVEFNQFDFDFDVDVDVDVDVDDEICSLFDLSDSILDDSGSDVIDTVITSSEYGAHIASTNIIIDANGPLVGIAELTELDELFGLDASELDDTWNGEQKLELDVENHQEVTTDVEVSSSELDDLLVFESTNFYINDKSNGELTVVQLFGSYLDDDTELESEVSEPSNPETTVEESLDNLFTPDTADETDVLDNIFGDVSFADYGADSRDSVDVEDIFLAPTPTNPEFLDAFDDFNEFWNTANDIVDISSVGNSNQESLFAETSNSDIFDSYVAPSSEGVDEVEQYSISDETDLFEELTPEQIFAVRDDINNDISVTANLNIETSLDEDINVEPSNLDFIEDESFAALEAILGISTDSTQPEAAIDDNNSSSNNIDTPIIDEFGDLEKLLAQSNDISSTANNAPTPLQRQNTRRTTTARFEQLMKVSVKHLDDMSNLVGELVVNRNTLEQDQERLRQSLDNLLIQIHHLSDVGARMQELYERSLLEASLLATRKHGFGGGTSGSHNNKDSERGFSELEMDRFTPFHTLSQEMIELIVRVRESASDIDFVTEETERVARQFRQVTTQLQEGLTKARMVPFSTVTDRVKRGVRDNAIKCGKQVELVIEGQDTLIDKMILEHLTDPLIHMLNNAIAHGIETPDERISHGKQAVGIITVRAFHQGNQTVISVSDDGAGINTDYVKQKAIKVGLITESQARLISRMEVYELLFQPNFSTKDQADDLAGRGVGMDVVRTSISEIRGTITTDSSLGRGTSFTIRLPLTLSICKALCCVWDKARIAFPMDGVEDTLDIPTKSILKNEKGESYILWRDSKLPFKPLKELLTLNRQLSRGSVYGGRDDDMVSVVVIRSASTLIGLQVDTVLSEQEIVIKQFEGPAPKPIGVAGATVLGDGRIMPIADVLEIIDIFQGRTAKQSPVPFFEASNNTESTSAKIDPTVLIVDDSITVRELLSLSFNKAGYRVEQARDGQEAWEKLRSGLPCDIVFCDIEMPRCDGLELLSRISKEPSLSQLPIAMLTSRGADKHKQMAINLGASGYFTKPYLEEALLEAAARMLKGEKLVGNSNG
ncbi:multi-sensor signal transduction histidine kinase [Calothrix sp. NIES-4071]|nr:multi-sensor signal transduction histidine kinase [Calothrix sp. NIES-4071]BAZ54391.1 multi-sensor signal transduction histidine kinase [Calothrix sp. NIES-4105]